MATQTLTLPSHLSDSELLAEVTRLAARERHATAALIVSLAELDARRLYLAQGCSSLFTYCTRVLHLSEHAAYGRIEAARAARRFPIVLDLLTEGSVNLTTIGLLAPHLTDGNHQQVLESARHKSKREVECLVAGLRPQPDVASAVRKLPSSKQSAVAPQPVERNTVECAAPASEAQSVDGPADRPPVVRPLAPERYKVQLTVSRATYEKLRRVQDLMRHTVPNGDPAVIFDRALTALLEGLEKTKLAATSRPRVARPSARASRHIPAAVKREVWRRDEGRCAFVGTRGRCSETGFLEFHHVSPFAEGGPSTVENIALRCRAHNAYEAEHYFGPRLVREERPEWNVRRKQEARKVDVCERGPAWTESVESRDWLLTRDRSSRRAQGRYWAAAALEARRAPRSRKTGEAIPRGEFLTCDPRRSHATTGASVRLACVAHPLPYSPRSERSESTS